MSGSRSRRPRTTRIPSGPADALPLCPVEAPGRAGLPLAYRRGVS
jgi:hypothetical protein